MLIARLVGASESAVVRASNGRYQYRSPSDAANDGPHLGRSHKQEKEDKERRGRREYDDDDRESRNGERRMRGEGESRVREMDVRSDLLGT